MLYGYVHLIIHWCPRKSNLWHKYFLWFWYGLLDGYLTAKKILLYVILFLSRSNCRLSGHLNSLIVWIQFFSLELLPFGKFRVFWEGHMYVHPENTQFCTGKKPKKKFPMSVDRCLSQTLSVAYFVAYFFSLCYPVISDNIASPTIPFMRHHAFCYRHYLD